VRRRQRPAQAADVRRLPRRRSGREQNRGDDLRLHRQKMTGGGQPVHFVPTLSPEDAARADFYALLARLFYAPPDTGLLESLAGAGELDSAEGDLAQAWRQLRSAAAATGEAAVREEYDASFVGTGKAPV